MRGWAQAIEPSYGPDTRAEGPPVIALIASPKYTDLDGLTKTIDSLVAKYPESVYVLRNKNPRDADGVIEERLMMQGVEPFCVPANRAYFGANAGTWRDCELITTCDRIVVFHDGKSAVTDYFVKRAKNNDRIHVEESHNLQGSPRRRKVASAVAR